MHVGFGVQVSFVKSVKFDTWSDVQICMMSAGGNESLFEFLQDYDLNQEEVPTRYGSAAVNYYSRKLCAFVEDRTFTEIRPQFDKGRDQCTNEFRLKVYEQLAQ